MVRLMRVLVAGTFLALTVGCTGDQFALFAKPKGTETVVMVSPQTLKGSIDGQLNGMAVKAKYATNRTGTTMRWNGKLKTGQSFAVTVTNQGKGEPGTERSKVRVECDGDENLQFCQSLLFAIQNGAQSPMMQAQAAMAGPAGNAFGMLPQGGMPGGTVQTSFQMPQNSAYPGDPGAYQGGPAAAYQGGPAAAYPGGPAAAYQGGARQPIRVEARQPIQVLQEPIKAVRELIRRAGMDLVSNEPERRYRSSSPLLITRDVRPREEET